MGIIGENVWVVLRYFLWYLIIKLNKFNEKIIFIFWMCNYDYLINLEKFVNIRWF